jgi:MarR family transcriptional regulator, organic hydroperoxide resistance regulator
MIDSAYIIHVVRTNSQARDGAHDIPTGDDPYAPIIADFRAAMAQIKCASSERLVRLGISMAQLHILYTLQRAGEMPMSRLADVLNVSVSNATGLIDRIEERGFVERTRVPEDRRIVMIRVTDAGRRMLDEVDAISTDLLRSVFGRIGRTQLAGVGRAIAELRRGLEEATGVPSDRHPASTPAPRSSSTIRAAEGARSVAPNDRPTVAASAKD